MRLFRIGHVAQFGPVVEDTEAQGRIFVVAECVRLLSFLELDSYTYTREEMSMKIMHGY